MGFGKRHEGKPRMLASGVAFTAALTVLGGVVGAASAGADTVSVATAISNSLPNGYSIASASFTATKMTQSSGTVLCPGALKPVSGGVATLSTSTLVNVNSSFPAENHRWQVLVNNASGADTTFTVYAVCIRRGASDFTVTSKAFTARPNAQSGGTVACPSGVVVGGGVLSTASSTALDVSINSLIPSGTTGWRAVMNNPDAVRSDFAVWAICKNTKPSGYSRRVGPVVDNPPGAHTQATVHCPGNSVPLSGGVHSGSRDTAVNLGESIPNGQTWLGFENNASGSDTSATAYAICAGK